LPGQYVTSGEFGMFCSTILFIFMLDFETGAVAGRFSEQFVTRALEHLPVPETLKPLFINAAIVVHNVQVVGKTVEGSERTGEQADSTPVGLCRLGVHIAGSLRTPRNNGVALLLRFCGFRLTPFNAKDLDHVIAQEIREKPPLVGAVQPTADSNHPLAESRCRDLRPHMAESLHPLLFPAVLLFEKGRCFFAQLQRNLSPREAIFGCHHPWLWQFCPHQTAFFEFETTSTGTVIITPDLRSFGVCAIGRSFRHMTPSKRLSKIIAVIPASSP
jgi:hypothetical protein